MYQSDSSRYLTVKRKNSGYSINALAAHIGVSPSTVRNIEQAGIGRVSTEIALAYCYSLGISIYEAYYEKDCAFRQIEQARRYA